MAKKRQEYDWLDDPFDEKKAAKDAQGMSGTAKTALGCGCLLVVAAFGGALFMYTQGWGYPSQDSVATQLFADPDNASALYSAEVSDTSAASMTNSLVKDSAPTINAVEKSMTDSTVYVTAETDGGGQMQYKLSMVRDLIGWKVSNVELYFPSQN